MAGNALIEAISENIGIYGMTNTLYTIPTLTRVPERGKFPPKIDPSLGLKRLNR